MPSSRNLCNSYFVMRHGQSKANEQSIIASSCNNGLDQFGLTKAGIEEVRDAIRCNRPILQLVTKIYASDFLRARQTAELVAEAMGIDLALAPALRERYFGDWDGQSNEYYLTTWQQDALDPGHQRWNVESVQCVADRLTRFVNPIDQTSADKTYLLVSHGDPLQILLTYIAGNDLGSHRQIDPLRTAEIRQLA